ncbi:MAG: hypothetical protein ACM3QS_15090 [Bacteroidota bacterium]
MSVIKFKKPREEPGTPRLAILVTILLIGSIIAVVVMQGSARPDSSTQAGAIEFAQSTQQVTPGQAMTITAGTVTVYLPQNATRSPGTVSIIPREPNLYPTAGDIAWSRPQIVNIEFRDAASTPYPDITFSLPAEVCFQLTQNQWGDYTQRPSNYQVQYYAETRNPPQWLPLTTTTHPQQAQICGQTNHFTLFALAIKSPVGVPITGATPFPTPRLYAP